MDKELREQIKYGRQKVVGVFLLCLCLGIALIHFIFHLVIDKDSIFTALLDQNVYSLIFLGCLSFLTVLFRNHTGRVIQLILCIVLASLAVIFSPPLSFAGVLIYIYTIILAIQYDFMKDRFILKVIIFFLYFGGLSIGISFARTEYPVFYGVVQFVVMLGFAFLYYLAFANELKAYLTETRRLRAEIDRNKVFIQFGKNVTGIVHNLKSKLNSIDGFNELLSEIHSETNHEANELLIYQKQAITQMIELVNSLLFAVKAYQLSDFGVVDVGKLIKSIVALFQANKKLTGSISFKLDLCDDCEIAISPGILLQIIENLIQNSLEAMVESEIKEITLRTNITGDEVLLQVCDTGCGINRCGLCADKDPCIECDDIKIGETTKTYGSGIGLVYIINALRAVKGRLKIDSRVGEGTCVSLWFPKNIDS